MDKPHDVHCYDETTEVLTQDGWKVFGDVSYQDKIAQWWPDNSVDFVNPSAIVWQDYTGEMVSIENARLSMLITPNHRVPRYTKTGKLEVSFARDIVNFVGGIKVPVAGKLVKEFGLSEEDETLLRLAVATQADGHFQKDCSAITFSFTKDAKFERLLGLLEKVNCTPTTSQYFRKGRLEHIIRVPSGEIANKIRGLLSENKELIHDVCVKYPEIVVNEFVFWDGTRCKNGATILDTTCKVSRDVLAACAVLTGHKTLCSEYSKTTTYGKTYIYRVYISNKNPVSTSGRGGGKVVHYSGKIGCVAVPSTFIIVRRKGKIYVSGNTVTAEKISKILGRKFERTPAKSIKYGCTYGAQAAKVAKQLGVPLSVGQTVYNAFWEAARPLKDLKEYIKAEWEGFGKKYIMGIDGRKVPTRAEHAILNSRFQSGGVICAKRAMVIHDRLLKKEGLSIDFFKECRYNKPFCQQLVSYHDEAQLEVAKSLVEFKTFATKEECNQFKETELANGKIWSDIKEAKNGGFFVAYSRAGELAARAVHQAGRDYGLNVDLTAGYVLGRNWRDCH